MAITQKQLGDSKQDSLNKFNAYKQVSSRFNVLKDQLKGMDKYEGDTKNASYVAVQTWFSFNKNNCSGFNNGCRDSVDELNNIEMPRLRNSYNAYILAEQQYQLLLKQYEAEGKASVISGAGAEAEANAWLLKYKNFILAAILGIVTIIIFVIVYKKYIKK